MPPATQRAPSGGSRIRQSGVSGQPRAEAGEAINMRAKVAEESNDVINTMQSLAPITLSLAEESVCK